MINAKEFEVKLRYEDLVKYISDNDMEKELRLVVEKVWNEIKEACTVNRKKRYGS